MSIRICICKYIYTYIYIYIYIIVLPITKKLKIFYAYYNNIYKYTYACKYI